MKRKLMILIILILPIALFASDIRTGVFLHDSGTIWGNLKKEYGADFGFEVLLGIGLIRPNIGMTLNSRGYTSKLYWGCVMESRSKLFVSLGLGGVLHSGKIHSRETKSLGSRLLFRVSGEIGIRFQEYSLSILLDHISNAGLAGLNDGLDILGIRIGWEI